MAVLPGAHEKQSLVLAPSRAFPHAALIIHGICHFSPEHSDFSDAWMISVRWEQERCAWHKNGAAGGQSRGQEEQLP